MYILVCSKRPTDGQKKVYANHGNSHTNIFFMVDFVGHHESSKKKKFVHIQNVWNLKRKI